MYLSSSVSSGLSDRKSIMMKLGGYGRFSSQYSLLLCFHFLNGRLFRAAKIRGCHKFVDVKTDESTSRVVVMYTAG